MGWERFPCIAMENEQTEISPEKGSHQWEQEAHRLFTHAASMKGKQAEMECADFCPATETSTAEHAFASTPGTRPNIPARVQNALIGRQMNLQHDSFRCKKG
jgi:hypothetical protein